MTVLTHWLMAFLFVGWGAFFVYTLIRFRSGRQPEGQLPRRQEPHGELHRVGRGRRRARADRRVRDPCLGRARRRVSQPRAKRPSFASSPSSSRGMRTIPGADGQFGRTDIKLVSADNPLGLDRSDPAAKDDFNSDQPAGAAGEQAGRSSTCRARTSSTASASFRCA